MLLCEDAEGILTTLGIKKLLLTGYGMAFLQAGQAKLTRDWKFMEGG